MLDGCGQCGPCHAWRNDRKPSNPATRQSHGWNQAQAAATQAARHTSGQHAAGMIKSYIGLGANLGDALASLQQAAAELLATPGITTLRLSRFYRRDRKSTRLNSSH